MLDKLLTWLQGEVKTYTQNAIENPGKGTPFEYGTHHGYVKALRRIEQRIEELLEEEENDEGK